MQNGKLPFQVIKKPTELEGYKFRVPTIHKFVELSKPVKVCNARLEGQGQLYIVDWYG